MKVLMFGWEFPPHISGGLGTACYGLVRGLLQNNVDVTFVVPKTFGDEDGENIRLLSAEDIPGMSAAGERSGKFTILGIEASIHPYTSPSSYQGTEYERGGSTRHFALPVPAFSGHYGKDLMAEVWRYANVAGDLARTEEFDVVHAHDWLSFPAGIYAAQVSHKPLVLHIHATEYDRSGDFLNRSVFEIEKYGMEFADRVIAVSEYTRQEIIRRYEIDPKKVFTIHNAVDPLPEKDKVEKRASPFREKLVTYLGRVTFQKGPEYFIEAAAKVLGKGSHYRFIMAGHGDLLFDMIRRVAGRRLSSRFHFTGFLNGNETERLLSMSDVYVMPSVSEPFGISSLEAARSGIPVIISRQSGSGEVLKNAVKLDFWDTDKMADAIYALANYRGLKKYVANRGLHDALSVSWAGQASKLKQLYYAL